MIRFPYQSFAFPSPKSRTFETVYRPFIPIWIFGPGGVDRTRGLVDTGADDTLLPDFLVRTLGIALTPGDQAMIAGIAGNKSMVRYGAVAFEIPGAGGGHRWSARVGFHADSRVVLGHVGFLEFFTATFNGRGRHLTLTPNGTAPPG